MPSTLERSRAPGGNYGTAVRDGARREAAVILAPEQYKRLLPKQKDELPLSRFLKGLACRLCMLSGRSIQKGHRPANGWLLDTNVISEMSGARSDPKVAKWFNAQVEQSLFLSILTIANIRKASSICLRRQAPPASAARGCCIGEAIFGPDFAGFEPDRPSLGRHQRRSERLTGHSPSVVDTLLAATAIEHGLYLATRNVLHAANSGAAVSIRGKTTQRSFRSEL